MINAQFVRSQQNSLFVQTKSELVSWMHNFAAKNQCAGGFVFNEKQKWSICNKFEVSAQFIGHLVDIDLCGLKGGAALLIDLDASLLQHVRH